MDKLVRGLVANWGETILRTGLISLRGGASVLIEEAVLNCFELSIKEILCHHVDDKKTRKRVGFSWAEISDSRVLCQFIPEFENLYTLCL